ncbi:MAG: hypothetical protein ACFFG0_19870 [Candidatus Thorarchaeota archaeon]
MSYKLYVVPKIASSLDNDLYHFSMEWQDAWVTAVAVGISTTIVVDMIPGPGVPG